MWYSYNKVGGLIVKDNIKAFFLDKDKNIIRCEISFCNIKKVDSTHIRINCYKNLEEVSYLRMFTGPYSTNMFLEIVYVYSAHRGKLIGQKMFDLVPYLINNFGCDKLVGSYEPDNYSTDREFGIGFDKINGTMATQYFYNKNGFTIVGIEDYLKDAKSYPDIDASDFNFGEVMINDLVISPIPLKNGNKYVSVNNTLIHIDDQDYFTGEYENE